MAFHELIRISDPYQYSRIRIPSDWNVDVWNLIKNKEKWKKEILENAIPGARK